MDRMNNIKNKKKISGGGRLSQDQIYEDRDNVYVDQDNRIIMLHDNIGAETTAKVNYWLLQFITQDSMGAGALKEYNPFPISLYIHSHGGYLNDMWSTIGIIESSKTPIYTVCTGIAQSAAFFIFISGHKRYIGKYAELMYHQLSDGTWGTYTDIKQDVNKIRKDQVKLEEYVCKKTALSRKELIKIRDEKRDRYIGANEAIRLKCADYIYGGE